jgi:hypothetical protein
VESGEERVKTIYSEGREQKKLFFWVLHQWILVFFSVMPIVSKSVMATLSHCSTSAPHLWLRSLSQFLSLLYWIPLASGLTTYTKIKPGLLGLLVAGVQSITPSYSNTINIIHPNKTSHKLSPSMQQNNHNNSQFIIDIESREYMAGGNIFLVII